MLNLVINYTKNLRTELRSGNQIIKIYTSAEGFSLWEAFFFTEHCLILKQKWTSEKKEISLLKIR